MARPLGEAAKKSDFLSGWTTKANSPPPQVLGHSFFFGNFLGGFSLSGPRVYPPPLSGPTTKKKTLFLRLPFVALKNQGSRRRNYILDLYGLISF